ncbi:MAG: universal stress protein [Mycobacterium sp.]|nr:universal stress protein [Mycobacterium sp.]
MDASTELPIVVGIDGSNAAINAALWAIDEALVRNVPLRLVTAIPPADQRESPGTLSPERKRAETALRAAKAAVLATGKPVKVETAVGFSAPQDLLIAESHSATMTCVGSVGIRRFAAKVLGSTAEAVASGAHCPVAIIRSHLERPECPNCLPVCNGWIALAINELPDSDDVAGLGFGEAALRNAGVIAVVTRSRAEDAEHDSLVDQTVDKWSARYPAVPVQTWMASRSLAQFIAGSEDPVQLVVVGRADLHHITQLVGPVGGLSHFEHTECSVLVSR